VSVIHSVVVRDDSGGQFRVSVLERIENRVKLPVDQGALEEKAALRGLEFLVKVDPNHASSMNALVNGRKTKEEIDVTSRRVYPFSRMTQLLFQEAGDTNLE
jgi:hypothetical protein